MIRAKIIRNQAKIAKNRKDSYRNKARRVQSTRRYKALSRVRGTDLVLANLARNFFDDVGL